MAYVMRNVRDKKTHGKPIFNLPHSYVTVLYNQMTI